MDNAESPRKRALLIIAALALPVVLLIAVISSGSGTPKNNIAAAGKIPVATTKATNIPPHILPHPTLEQERATVKARLAELQKMTPDQWPAERKKHPNVPPTLQEAISYNTQRLAQLNAMTPEQWEAQFKPKPSVAQQNSALDIIPKPASTQKPVLPPISR